MSVLLGFLRQGSPLRSRLSYCKRQLAWLLKRWKVPGREFVRFQCNICGEHVSFPRNEMSRELWSCRHCGSNVRFRSVIHALSTELFGQSLVIGDFPASADLLGVGLSDWEEYGRRLKDKLGYQNTYYHQAPFLDITTVDPAQFSAYDFIISSDVFEHVCQPISKAFVNAAKLLKPGGVMILTVPYVGGETREHYPEVSDFTLEKAEDEWFLIGTQLDGKTERFSNVTFHGGPGTTVEFRLFGKETMMRDCESAGFNSIRIHDETVPEFGIYWNAYVAEDAPYRPLIYGLDTPPWALRSVAK